MHAQVAVYVPFNNAGVVVQGGGSFSAVDCCFCPDKEPDDAMTSGFGIKLMDSATACLVRIAPCWSCLCAWHCDM